MTSVSSRLCGAGGFGLGFDRTLEAAEQFGFSFDSSATLDASLELEIDLAFGYKTTPGLATAPQYEQHGGNDPNGTVSSCHSAGD